MKLLAATFCLQIEVREERKTNKQQLLGQILRTVIASAVCILENVLYYWCSIMFLNQQPVLQEHGFDEMIHKDSLNPGIKPSTRTQIPP